MIIIDMCGTEHGLSLVGCIVNEWKRVIKEIEDTDSLWSLKSPARSIPSCQFVYKSQPLPSKNTGV